MVDTSFQTLIGTVKRFVLGVLEAMLNLFQTLIGTVKRAALGAGGAPGLGVSNPHRYGQKGGTWGRRCAGSWGFKPS